ncbi:MAG TPA: hypothetical protein DCX54_09960 [Flavobacteriales bacterium]|nr:hypothetical protein [Flavobacteriales bacterium]
MKAAKLIFSLIILSFSLHSQEIDDLLVYDQKEYDRLLKSTTYVVLDQYSESGFSKALTAAVEKYWDLTKFEIIDQGTYREYINDKTKSFLTRNYIAGDKDWITLNLFMGGQKSMETKGKIVASVKMKHYTEPDEDMLYKIPVFVQNIQWQFRMVKNNAYTSASDFNKYYKTQSMVMKTRTLYILNQHLTNKVESLEKVKDYYKNDVSLVDAEQINQAITNQDSNVVFLSIVAPTKNWSGRDGYYRIYTANGGQTVIGYTRSVSSSAPLGVTGYDLKTFNK